MAKVSVIIPNYRHAPYLQERIDSVLAQTWRDFEIIILDDCSPDNSREVIERYRGNERITHIVYNEQNSGSTFVQWQKGFDLSQGEYIWIAESDDFAEPGFLAACVEQLDQDPACTLAYTESRLVDAESRPMKKRMKKAYSRDESVTYGDGEEFIVANMLRWQHGIQRQHGRLPQVGTSRRQELHRVPSQRRLAVLGRDSPPRQSGSHQQGIEQFQAAQRKGYPHDPSRRHRPGRAAAALRHTAGPHSPAPPHPLGLSKGA